MNQSRLVLLVIVASLALVSSQNDEFEDTFDDDFDQNAEDPLPNDSSDDYGDAIAVDADDADDDDDGDEKHGPGLSCAYCNCLRSRVCRLRCPRQCFDGGSGGGGFGPGGGNIFQYCLVCSCAETQCFINCRQCSFGGGGFGSGGGGVGGLGGFFGSGFGFQDGADNDESNREA
ncbi:forkhead box protein D1-like [Tigriopus californicus]|uniref:forkhead box protein D1-like n=1 Tax=Tigriopus californicus TaxID=6832 RepID=UPI0027DA743F|nr:forkhead box protein D1-like [Tigriopus californicus]